MPVRGTKYTRVHDWTNDAANEIPIDAGRFDEEFDDLATVINGILEDVDGILNVTGIVQSSPGVYNWNMQQNPQVQLTLSQNTRINLANPRNGRSYVLWVKQSAAGRHTLTFSGVMLDRGALNGQVDPDANQITMFAFTYVFGRLRLLSQRVDFSG